MTLSVGDFVQTTCNFLLQNGVEYQNVYHHVFDGIGGISDAAVVSDIGDWASAMYEELGAYVKDSVVEQLSSVDRVEWVTDEWKITENLGTFTPGFTPSAVTGPLPNQVSPFIVFKTGRPRTVGRKFMFPFMASDQASGVLVGGAIAALVAFADDAVNDIFLDVANGLVPGVVRVGVDEWWPFTVAIVTDLLGTQRRRRPGYGA